MTRTAALRWLQTRAIAPLGLGLMLGLIVLGSALAYTDHLPRMFFRFAHADKVCHAVVYGLSAFFLDAILRWREVRRVPLAALVVLIVGGVEELTQGLSVIRECSALDFAADVVGVVFWVTTGRMSRQTRAPTMV